ncbi:hypothetical protein BLL42_27450 (plasmid) [Pseudomonas frederiksbergensis]|uniref:Uncharacterized protein n=1 Tax=Pseudomonas frederiksbergensis TaxID=104087 RepID=A0A1J0ETN9_9PSED|nr:hypothetical protein [Pseudomonas frederiksbergensis]APC19473.1 hypothetical protein BLL42_27450 [Pseudomonas frederiksbergensis]
MATKVPQTQLFQHRKQQLYVPSLIYLLGTAGALAATWLLKHHLESVLPIIPFFLALFIQQSGAREDLTLKARVGNAIALTILAIACEIFYQAAIGVDTPTAYFFYPFLCAIGLLGDTACRWIDQAEQNDSPFVKILGIAIFLTGIGIGLYALYLKNV